MEKSRTDQAKGTENGQAPAKQARSRQTRERLINAGIALFEQRDFDSITLGELARSAGCSVGAVYHHFADKEGYYEAVIAAQLERLWRTFEEEFRADDLEDLPTRALVARGVGFIRQIMAENRGLLRNSFRRALDEPEAWAPIRAFGRAYEDRLADLLAPRRADFAVPDWPAAFAFGMQVVYSTLLNAVLNRPGPLAIEDDRIVTELSTVLNRYLVIGD